MSKISDCEASVISVSFFDLHPVAEDSLDVIYSEFSVQKQITGEPTLYATEQKFS